MSTRHRTDRLAALLLAFVLLAPSPGGAQGLGGVPVAERYFSVTSDVVRSPKGPTLIWGTVANSFNRGARNVSLLIEGLDGSGQPVSKTIAWVNGDIATGSSRYFQAPAPSPGTTFRVTVLHFDWTPDGGIGN